MRFDTLAGWLEWQSSLHPAAIDLGLERVAEVWRRLGGRIVCPLVTVAGTNGKGSSVAMLDAIWQAAGYRVGSFSSPHLMRYNERIRLDGEPLSDAAIIEAFARIDRARGDLSLTYFEFGALAALDCFARARPDVVVLETGLGGRLDAVNIVDADVALITAIGLDHTEWLGEDRDRIAREKAGILRAGRAAVCSDPQAPAGLLEQAARLDVPLRVYRRDFDATPNPGGGWRWSMEGRRREALPLPALRGDYQLQNAAGALAVTELLGGRLPLETAAIREGLASVSLPGRFEVRPGRPTLILDVAHNTQAVAALRDTLRRYRCRGRVLAVFSALRDKRLGEMIARIDDRIHQWHPAGLEGPRGLDGKTVAAAVARHAHGRRAPPRERVSEALGDALAEARDDDCILVFGSFLSVAAACRALEDHDGQARRTMTPEHDGR